MLCLKLWYFHYIDWSSKSKVSILHAMQSLEKYMFNTEKSFFKLKKILLSDHKKSKKGQEFEKNTEKILINFFVFRRAIFFFFFESKTILRANDKIFVEIYSDTFDLFWWLFYHICKYTQSQGNVYWIIQMFFFISCIIWFADPSNYFS